MDSFKLISIDVGLKTTSFCCETYTIDQHPIFPTQKYDRNGEACPDFYSCVEAIAKCGCVNHLDKVDLGTKKEFFAGVCFVRLYEWLETKREYFQDVNIVLIEQQMKVNPTAQALSHHIHAWILIQTGAKVIMYPSKNKTRVLGMPLKVINKKGKLVKATKYQRKRWSIGVAEKILLARDDKPNLDLIFKQNKSKKDDLCDTMIQGLSYIVTQSMKAK
jgi:hypothetical protein